MCRNEMVFVAVVTVFCNGTLYGFSEWWVGGVCIAMLSIALV